jgi:hypothetical protein
VAGLSVVAGGVLADRRVAAAHVAAHEALAQVYPRLAYLQAFLAPFRAGLRLRAGNALHVFAFRHRFILSFFEDRTFAFDD